MMPSEYARRFLKRLDSRRSAAPPRPKRLTGFEPLEPRTVLSAAGMSHFSGDDFPGHGQNQSHGMGSYEKELHSAAEVARGSEGKSTESQRFVEVPRYEPSHNEPPATSTSL